MRYVQVPGPVTVLNPFNDEPIEVPDGKGGMKRDVYTFARSCRTALVLSASKSQTLSLMILDIKKRIDEAKVGDIIDFSDDEWKVLEAEFKTPNAQAFGTGWLFSAEDHIRAVMDAPTKKPAVYVETAAPADPAQAAS